MSTKPPTSIAKPATIHDVARATGLSKSTVSRALIGEGKVSLEAREAVLLAARDLGYDTNYFAQGLRAQRTDVIGFFSPDLDLGTSTLKVQAIGRLLNERGYTVPIMAYANREGGARIEQEKLLSNLRRQKPRALICNARNLQSERAHQALRGYLEEGGIAVAYDEALDIETDMVLFDREHNTYLATRHLLERGHREIGLNAARAALSGPTRIAGFKRALSEAGIEARPDWIASVPYHAEAEHEGAALAQWFLALPKRPGAMCVVSDVVSATFVAELARAGVMVPRDLSLVSHDNLAIARYGMVPLSTVSHPIEAIASAVVEMLDDRLTGTYDGPPRRRVVRGELFERDSVRDAS